ncbi:hypothetical protein GCM10011409_15550 [Lentibacillus populi]|uniref:D-glycerate dehydrogenase n=1 Tax=Lentibacillus populi TaxID=1827502 RepID=A0A9W5TWN7_9BACI|nr:hypothetical protein GCM10011409_15550 [Lentibacillus populi]
MKPEIILYNLIPNELLEQLKEHFIVRYHKLDTKMNASFYEDLIKAKGIIGSKMKINRTLLKKAPNLKVVVNISVGYDNLDLTELTNRGIMATNTPDVLTDTVADAIFGLLLSTSRRIPELNDYVKSGKWNENIGEELFGIDVHHKTLGIIGMGRIGTAIAERARHGFKMNILYHNRSNNQKAEKELNATHVNFEQLLRTQILFACWFRYVPKRFI